MDTSSLATFASRRSPATPPKTLRQPAAARRHQPGPRAADVAEAASRLARCDGQLSPGAGDDRQIPCDAFQIGPMAGARRRFDPVGQLLERQAPLGRRIAQGGVRGVAVGVGRPQRRLGARRAAAASSETFTACPRASSWKCGRRPSSGMSSRRRAAPLRRVRPASSAPETRCSATCGCDHDVCARASPSGWPATVLERWCIDGRRRTGAGGARTVKVRPRGVGPALRVLIPRVLE